MSWDDPSGGREWARRIREMKRRYAAKRARGARELREWFGRLRAARNLTEEALADAVGVDPVAQRAIEQAAVPLSQAYLAALRGAVPLSEQEESELSAVLEDLWA